MGQHKADSMEAWLPCIVCSSYLSLRVVGKIENFTNKIHIQATMGEGDRLGHDAAFLLDASFEHVL